MKKEYKKPTIEVLKMQPVLLQSQSTPEILEGKKEGDQEPEWADLD